MTAAERIAEIEKQLVLLLVGKLTYKAIKGKAQPYLQRSEKGKMISRYVKVGERELVLQQLE